MAIIELQDVYKIYEEAKVNAVNGASLKIEKGEAVILLGPSGSGKSTMMHLIGCLDLPTKGKILLDGKDISKLSESDLAKLRGKKIGFVFQTFNLIPHLTALENVSLAMDLQEVDAIKARERSKKLLELVGLEKRINHYPPQLSGGERQRVAVARALANDPDLILADEPTGNLDSKTGQNIMTLLSNLNKKQGKTLVVVTHDKSLKDYGTKVIYMKDGKVEKVRKQ